MESRTIYIYLKLKVLNVSDTNVQVISPKSYFWSLLGVNDLFRGKLKFSINFPNPIPKFILKNLLFYNLYIFWCNIKCSIRIYLIWIKSNLTKIFRKLTKTYWILNAQLAKIYKNDFSFIQNNQYFKVKWYIICSII